MNQHRYAAKSALEAIKDKCKADAANRSRHFFRVMLDDHACNSFSHELLLSIEQGEPGTGATGNTPSLMNDVSIAQQMLR